MKKYIIASLLSGIALAGFSQSKLDLQSRMSLFKSQVESQKQARRAPQQKNSEVTVNRTTAFVELKSDSTVAEMEANGVTVLRQYGKIAIVSLPVSQVEDIAQLKSVKRMQLARKVKAKMNEARRVTGIDKIHSGLELPQAYTGKGVVTGLVDNGFDANHINFRDKNGKTRLGYMSRYIQSEASKDGYVCYNYYPEGEFDPEEDMTFSIESFTCDNSTNYHGTHTCGIMSGCYQGETTYSTDPQNKGYSVNTTGPNPYYGSALDAEIICSCGDLVDTFIAMGVEDIYNYALYSNGYDKKFNPTQPKPCVANLSLGSNLGAHDPNYMFNQVLDIFSEKMIICVASGNEADYPIAVNKTLTNQDSTLMTFIRPIYEGVFSDNSGNNYYNLRSGELLIYADDDQEFEVQVVIYNKSRGNIAKRFAISGSTEGNMVVWTSGGDYAISGATEDVTFARNFDGYIGMASLLDTDLNRFYAGISYLMSDNQTSNASGNYIIGIQVNGKPGQRIDVYGDDGYCYFDSYGYEAKGWLNGSKNGTINDMACGYNTICVGAYNVKSHWASMDGYTYGYEGFPEGEVSRFSSYGTLADGRNLPHICAPGTTIISSINTYAVQNPSMGWTNAALQATCTEEVTGRANYWMQERGTSMATPVVAGAIALWLEADPELTVLEAREIIQKTAIVDEDVLKGDSVQWGAGKFDAYAGLKEVLRRKSTGLGVTMADQSSETLITQCGERQFRVLSAGAKKVQVCIYNTSGQVISKTQTNGDEAYIDASSWTNGIYIIQVNGSAGQRIIVK